MYKVSDKIYHKKSINFEEKLKKKLDVVAAENNLNFSECVTSLLKHSLEEYSKNKIEIVSRDAHIVKKKY